LSPSNRVFRRDLAVSCNNLGLTYSKLERGGEAEDSFNEALRLQRELVAEDAQDAESQSSLGGIYNNLGILLEGAGRLSQAAEHFQKAVAHQRAAFERAPSVARYREFLSKHYFNQGRVLRQLKRGDEAASAAVERKKLWPGDPDRLYSVAEELALASESLTALPQRRAAASECAQLAISTLQDAAVAGHVLDSKVARDKSFVALQNNPAFTALFHE
jgi:tetratricopeptide (TPR) repeat protein